MKTDEGKLLLFKHLIDKNSSDVEFEKYRRKTLKNIGHEILSNIDPMRLFDILRGFRREYNIFNDIY